MTLVGQAKKATKQLLRHMAPRAVIHRKATRSSLPYLHALSHSSSSCRYRKRKVEQLLEMLRTSDIELFPNERFQSWIDKEKLCENLDRVIGNLPPDYGLIVNGSLDGLSAMWEGEGRYREDERRLIEGVRAYFRRLASLSEGEERLNAFKCVCERMEHVPASTLEEALQRILIWSNLLWQSGHRLMGLGRLDLILDGLSYGSEDEAVETIKRFMLALHEEYAFKSDAMNGDTGQIILLGGCDRSGAPFENELTHCFIRAMRELRLPDPKLMLRVSSMTSRSLLSEAVSCIETGIGCPILANDDRIMPAIEEFGYEECDARDYAVSACWETLVCGRSFGQNNLDGVNYAEAVSRVLTSDNVMSFEGYDELLDAVQEELCSQTEGVKERLDRIEWEPDPLLSLFFADCASLGKDISCGGCGYNDYGINNMGMSNAVNSLINVSRLVFSDGATMDMSAVREALQSDYAACPELRDSLLSHGVFGTEDNEAVELVERLTGIVEDSLCWYRNPLGGRLKWGHSSSTYVSGGKETGATFDGRRAGEPLGVHISAPMGTAYTELVSFASRLDYGGCRANGNVVDFFVAPSLLAENHDKFVMFLQGAIEMGFFEMQMNVVSSDTLIKAKENPAAFPELVVRVWGFSAYFKDLPEEYQDVLIRRALDAEAA